MINMPYTRFLLGVIGSLIIFACSFYLVVNYSYGHLAFDVGDILSYADQQISLEAIDFTEDPGGFESHEMRNQFYARQDRLAQLMGQIFLPSTWQQVSHLYWIQIIVAISGLLISTWVWSLNPRKLEAKMFALSGLALAVSAGTSAVYTARSLAIPARFFAPLSHLNSGTALIFGMAMVTLFMSYPKKLRWWKEVSLSTAIIFSVWIISNVFQLFSFTANYNLAIVILMFLLIIAIGAQYIAARKDPKAKAILSWLGLGVLIGAGFFVFFNTLPHLFGLPPVDQAYAFLSFVVIYLGLAAGIKQYRLFDIGDWAFKFFFYSLGTLLLMLLDVALIYLAELERLPALTISLLVISLLYLPLRDQLRRKISARLESPPGELLSHALNVLFTSSAKEQLERWKSFLFNHFQLLAIEEYQHDVPVVAISNQGTEMLVPRFAQHPALKLTYPWKGKTLFHSRDIRAIQELLVFLEQANQGRQDYEKGMREERLRVAKELHDDLGSKLLSGLHQADEKSRPMFEAAIQEMREIVAEMTAQLVPLADTLANTRFETAERLQASKIHLDWPLSTNMADYSLSNTAAKSLRALVREIVSNVIKHSQASTFKVQVHIENDWLHLILADDGIAQHRDFIPSKGHGLKNIFQRVQDVAGEIEINGSTFKIKWPLVSD